MKLVLVFLGLGVLILSLDWVLCTRLGAYYAERYYKYKITARRMAVMSILVVFLVYFWSVNDTAHPWMTGIMLSAVIILIYAAIAAADVKVGAHENGPEPNYADED